MLKIPSTKPRKSDGDRRLKPSAKLYLIYYIILYCIMLCYIILYHITSHHIISYHITLHYIILHYIILYYIILYYIILYYVILYYYYIILFYFILFYIIYYCSIRTDRHFEANSSFSQFCDGAPTKNRIIRPKRIHSHVTGLSPLVFFSFIRNPRDDC